MTLFKDRTDAGQALAAELSGKAYEDPVILALPRGGVPVAAEVARVLNAPVDLIMVRKIGAPEQPELAVAAVVNGSDPKIVTNPEIARSFGLAAADIKRMSRPRLEEIRRRREVYLKGRKQVPLRGRTAIVVDDGIATGATVRASLRAVRARKPARLVLAVPVAPRDVAEALRDEVDELISSVPPDGVNSAGSAG